MKRVAELGLLLGFMGGMAVQSGYCVEAISRAEDPSPKQRRAIQKISHIGTFELLCHLWEAAETDAVQVAKAIELAIKPLNFKDHSKVVFNNIIRLAEVASKEGLDWPESKKCSLVMICDLALRFLDDLHLALDFWKNQKGKAFDLKTIDDRINRVTLALG